MENLIELIYSKVSAKKLSGNEALKLIKGLESRKSAKVFLHPLLQENTSSISEQRFSSTFTGVEFFLKDHLVKGRKVFPGVAYLEMAREAIQVAVDGLSSDRRIQLQNVVWSRPIVVEDQPVKVNIGLFPQENGEINYEIYTENPLPEKEPIVHSQGVAVRVPLSEESSLNLVDLQTRLSKMHLSREDCYAAFKRLEVDYGPTFQGIDSIYIGDHEVLAKLTLPNLVAKTLDHFTLHPSLLDSALQASIGIVWGEQEVRPNILRTTLPFALERLEIIERCTECMWAWVRASAPDAPSDKVQKLDIDLCNKEGVVCVKMRGFSSRVLEGELDTGQESKNSAETSAGLITLSPVWNSITVEKKTASAEEKTHIIVIGGTQKQKDIMDKLYPQAKTLDIESNANIGDITLQLEEQGTIKHIVWIAPQDAGETQNIIRSQDQGVLQVFRIIKAMLSLDYGTKDMTWTLITTQTQSVQDADRVNPTHAGVHGLAGSLVEEYPHWNIQLFDMEEGDDWPIEEMFSLSYPTQGSTLAFRRGEWFVREMLDVRELPAERELCKIGGIYVVIGGAGGLGEVWSRWMIEKYQAEIIWIGRRAMDTAIKEKVDALSNAGPAPSYIQADAGNKESLKKAYQQIKQNHTKINGVIHAAIVLSDSSLTNMDEDQFKVGLQSKVDVSVCVADVFEKESLDFVLFFSSMVAFGNAAGQSNYAAGCSFKDAFAHMLSFKWSCPVKVMNWSYWGSVGIVADFFYQERMKKIGVGSIEPKEGMRALEKLVNGSLDQLALIKALKSDTLGKMKPREWISGYSQTYPEEPQQNLKSLFAYQDTKWDPKVANDLQQDPEMEELFCKFLLCYVQPFLNSITGLLDRYDRWMQESLSVLRSMNYLKKRDDGSHLLVEAGLSLDALWNQWDQQKVHWTQDAYKNAQVNLADACLRALPEILTGKKQTTDVMFPNASMELVEGIYKGNALSDLFNDILGEILTAYIQHRKSQDASSKIRLLEIGAGTGGTTAGLLLKLRPFQESIETYCYSDLSKAFLMHGKEQYAAQNPYLKTQIFDVEKPIAAQGVEADHYDVVIATNVLHATENIRQTLRNVKAAMHKGGILLLSEMSTMSLFAHLTFGLLDGWWKYEDSGLRIPGSPGLYPETWDRILREEGFETVYSSSEKLHSLGQQIIVAQSDGMVRQMKFMVNPTVKKTETKAASPSNSVSQTTLVYEKTLRGQTAIRGNIDVTDQMVKDHVRSILRESIAHVLKIDERELQDDLSFSEYGVDSILAVHLVTQLNKQLNILLQTTVLFDYNSVDQLVKHIIGNHKSELMISLQENVCCSVDESVSISHQRAGVPLPLEFVEGNSYNGSQKQRNRFRLQGSAFHQDPPIPQNQSTYSRLVIDGPGTIDKLKIHDAVVPELQENEVRVSVRSFSLNFGDLLCVKGLYPTMPPYPFTPGFEASGIVTAAGRTVTSVHVGDSVFVGMGEELGGHATMITCLEEHVFLKPSTLTFEEMSALPAVALTMIDAFQKAELQPGEKILIQTAAGGTGLIAVQLAKYYGAEIYATAGSPHKLAYLETLGVPHRINYLEMDFEQEIKRLTGGDGVDVVINTLAGDGMQKGLNCLASGGRYIEIAMTGLKSANAIDLSVLNSNQSFYSVDMRKLASKRPEKLKAYQSEMLGLVEQGVIRPTICKVFPFNQIHEAYRFMENRRNIGKIVVQVPEMSQFRESTELEIPPTVQEGIQATSSTEQTTIAIIGMSGRFAQSETLNDFWEHLSKGTDLVKEVSRWDLSTLCSNTTKNGNNYCCRGSFLESIDQFDPLFFNISPSEATYMDPQQRLFLEESWKALEDAGYAGENVEGKRCGVYVGCAPGDYSKLFSKKPPAQAFWGNAGSVIPSRIAYYLNLQGPTVAVDTACSSSLVAIHLACQSLWLNETEMALAGGVFIQSTSEFYLSANEGGMLSPTGRCHTFDEKADGFVPGEGLGVIVLKRLDNAVSDGDHIYAVIRGSGINQDGATNGITAPSAKSQERLEKEVYDRFQISPENIQMVEAHGTGTKLGDPIEYSALSRTFRKYTEKESYCAIGSVKTNIGHLATAAGISGMIKILLSLKHKKIPPSLHYKSGNPNIAFQRSPFYVNTQLQDWEVEENVKRQAAISSFGFSGTNAHMVIEEAPVTACNHPEKPGYLIVLSARTSEQLYHQVKNILKFCTEETEIDLGNTSYTLLLGRKHWNHRLACVVRSIKELIRSLEKWLGKGKVSQVYTSNLGEGEIREQVALQRFGNQCIGECRKTENAAQYLEHLSSIADLYIQGYRLAYEELFIHGYIRISLPSYPFAREHYWVSESSNQLSVVGNQLSVIIHPLLHKNTSNLSEQRFSSTFTGKEFFLKDHKVKGEKILPGMAYLEMAREAIKQAAGEDSKTGQYIQLKNVVWTRPIAVGDQSVEVHIGMVPEENGEIAFEIYTDKQNSEGQSSVHSQGRAVFVSSEDEPVSLNLAELQKKLNINSFSHKDCYEALKRIGLDYGPAHQGIDQVYIGDSQVLAHLTLPSSVLATKGQFILHPSLLDSAVQAAIGLGGEDIRFISKSKPARPSLPFALEELEIVDRCTKSMWVWLRFSDNCVASDKVQRLDIDLCDEEGEVCVKMRGYSSRYMEADAIFPLIRNDHSSIEEPQFTTTFTGAEFFLRDHGMTLPGVVYLEMARMAGELAGDKEVLGLKNIVWSSPIDVDEKKQKVSIRLCPQNGGYRYTISTLHETENMQDVLHAQGHLISAKNNGEMRPAPLDIQKIQSRCHSMMGVEDFDQLVSKSIHGPSMLAVECFQHNGDEALATLKLPACVEQECKNYILNPSIMHGAVLSAVALSLIRDSKNKKNVFFLPFALSELLIYEKMPDFAYVHVRQSPQQDSNAKARQYDIDLTDGQGRVAISFKKLMARPLQDVQKEKIVYAIPDWQRKILPEEMKSPQTEEPVFLLACPDPELQAVLRQQWPHSKIDTLLYSGDPDKDPADGIQANFLQVFRTIQTLIKEKTEHIQPLVILTSGDEENYIHGIFSGLFETARLENPKIAAKVVRYTYRDYQDIQPLIRFLGEEIKDFGGDVDVLYAPEKSREVKKLREIDLSFRKKEGTELQAGDVLWITGGLGGLGQIFTKHFGITKKVKIILSGRSFLDKSKRKILEQFQANGMEVVYWPCDISDKEAVKSLVRKIEKEYGKLNGIFHSAGIIEDAYIVKKTTEEIQHVLRPKITGILAIHEATKNIKLEFIVLFSSISAFGSPGQADYSGANSFLDAFSYDRNQWVKQGRCFGKTLSLNWPLWKEGGMTLDLQTESLMKQNTGMTALATRTGIETLVLALKGNYEHVFVAPGNPKIIREKVFQIQESPQVASQAEPLDKAIKVNGNCEDEAIIESTYKELVHWVSNLQKIASEKISLEADLIKYGFDSIGFTEFANRLNTVYGLELMPTVFFEHSNLQSLGRYLANNHWESLLKKHGRAQNNPVLVQHSAIIKQSHTEHQTHPGVIGRKHLPRFQNSRHYFEDNKDEPIAIIGASGQFPGCKNLEEFWRHLEAEKDLISEIPKDRWDWREYYGDPYQEKGKTKIKEGGFLANVDQFDPLFFGISPHEAELMDPQLRLMLETVWQTVEDAGYQASALHGSKTGVFVGVSTSDYKDLYQDMTLEMDVGPSNYHFMIANRISYLLDFRGPSEAIDTACSSSLVALHRAIESIHQKSSEMAIVGGVNVMVSPQIFVSASQAGILSGDGRCKTFDKQADGYGRGEGVGALFLKPLSKAIKDGDHIYTLISGSNENHGGRATSPTAPNPIAEQELLIGAYSKAGIDPSTVSYIEAHGTGTELGDPIEVNGLKGAFAELYKQQGLHMCTEPHCGLGSVKTNIGHLEAAAGISGVIKVLLMMQHHKIPGNIHLKEQNPYLQLEGSPFYLVQETREWESILDENGHAMPRRAGVSSFGVGGANAHVILEEYLEKSSGGRVQSSESGKGKSALIVLSAKNEERLKEYARKLLKYVSRHLTPDTSLLSDHSTQTTDNCSLFTTDLFDLAYTLQVGREAMEERLGLIVNSIEELEEKLNKFLENHDDVEDLYRGQVKRDKDSLAVFAADEDMANTTEAWMAKGKHNKLLNLWVKGLIVDWDKLYGDRKPRRISVPTYPFARERYWVESQDSKGSGTVSSGNLSVTVRKSSSRVPEGELSEKYDVIGNLLLKPVWLESPVDPNQIATEYTEHRVFLCGLNQNRQSMQDRGSQISFIDLKSDQRAIEKRFADYALGLFAIIQKILQEKPKGKSLLQVLIPTEGPEQVFSGLSGLLKTARLENPGILGQLIAVQKNERTQDLLAILQENRKTPEDQYIRYEGNKRLISSFEQLPISELRNDTPWKDGGVYLITGGIGGLGLIFAKEMVGKIKNIKLILTGRSELSDKKKAILKKIEHAAALIEYRTVDVSDKASVDTLIQGIVKDFGELNGIIHSAGVIKDNFILKKNSQEFAHVLAPKVQGVMNLDQATKDLDHLDFFVLFSSGSGAMGNAGQADYSTANAFMDAFATYRHSLCLSRKRSGRTLSINWPLWRDGGMGVDEANQKMMEDELGITAMETASGITAFYQGLSSKEPQVMVLEGYLEKMKSHVLANPSVKKAFFEMPSISRVNSEFLKEKTLYQLKVILGKVTKLSPSKIDPEESLESYGIDSMMITRLNQKLENIFGKISKTLFYEYQTLAGVIDYFLAQYPQACAQWTGLDESIPDTSETSVSESVVVDKFSELVSLESKDSHSREFSEDTSENRIQEPIAIIGISGRYPQAKNLDEYWENLKSGKDCIMEIPRDRWDWEKYYEEDSGQASVLKKSANKWGGFLENCYDFDPLFFNIPPREAECIDPQERIFLEEVWKALEDAGYAPSRFPTELRQKTGVFAGITKQGYNLYSLEEAGQLPATSFASLVNRVSYHLDLQGPSIPVDTMCSSALVAIHQACDYLRHGNGSLAIAGAVNLYLHPLTYVGLSMAQVISTTKDSAAFEKGGSGFVPGEGVGAVILKPYSSAIRDQDCIYALIRGTAVNHGGKTNSYTVPNPNQQVSVIQQALEHDNLDPRSIGYIESSANGSEMGDAIEMTALSQVFANRAGTQGNYKIGSVKRNAGHSEAASGMSQLSKVILSLKHKTLVPTLLKGELNPNIQFDQLPFQLQKDLSEWTPVMVDGISMPRRAGITSVGAGGVNAHIIVEEYIPEEKSSGFPKNDASPFLFILSAKNQNRLEEYVKEWIAYFSMNPDADCERITYTLQVGREAMSSRIAIVSLSQSDLLNQLKIWANGEENNKTCFSGDVKTRHVKIDDGVDQALETNNVHELAKRWVLGHEISWQNLNLENQLSRLSGLPVYPFMKKRCKIQTGQSNDSLEEECQLEIRSPEYENKAVEFYSLWAAKSNGELQHDYLTFCPFPEKIPGMSISRFFLNPKKDPEMGKLVKFRQIEMRQVLFCKEDFSQIQSVLDFGCGHGTDVIQIAKVYPHIQTHGYTITQDQANLGNKRIAKCNLSHQVKIFHKDSSKDKFPSRYDLVIGIEVSFHIRNKEGLFQNISSSLKKNGRILLMDFIVNLRGAIIDPNVEISIPTREEWIDLLARHQLIIDEIIDVSPEIANFLYDPEFEQNIKDFPKVAQDTYRNYANQSMAIDKGWISYCLFKLRKEELFNPQECRDYNANKLSNMTPYSEALQNMLKKGHIPYPEAGLTGQKEILKQIPNLDQDNQIDIPENQKTLLERRAKIKANLLEIFIQVLGFEKDEIDALETFQELGITSVNAVELLERVNVKFDLNLPTSIVFESNTLDSFAHYIQKSLPEMYFQQASHTDLRIKVPSRSLAPGYSDSEATHHHVPEKNETIAIVGLSCRCAGANDQDEFWKLVSQGKACIEEVKNKRWLDFFSLHATKPMFIRYGQMEGLEYFDPMFFNISPKEAALMDVSQRIVLEESYNALEDAGYTSACLKEQSVGTFLGVTGNTPSVQGFSHFSMLGSETSILSARLAYFLDLKGPALAINTACSSSLVAMDLACLQLKSRQVNLAIAGGITIYNDPGAFISMNNAGMLSPTGECRPFDNEANGIVVGDGVGIVILKRLHDAKRDRDRIYGIIRGSGTNQDGQTSGITVPSFLSQSQLEESVYKKSKIDVEDIHYVEAHGTGTKLGDPVEIHALTDSFRKFTGKKNFCALSALKGNTGHTTGAAGVLGVIKVLLSMKYRQIPPCIHFSKENENIEFGESPFYVNTSLKEWQPDARGSRLAAVSSFGFSGTNAHMVLEEYVEKGSGFRVQGSEFGKDKPALIVLSAKKQDRLKEYARKLLKYVSRHLTPDTSLLFDHSTQATDNRSPITDNGSLIADHSPQVTDHLQDLAYTLQVGREAMEERLGIIVHSMQELAEKLHAFIAGNDEGDDIYLGGVKRNKDAMALLAADDDLQKTLEDWIDKRKYGKILNLWIKGLNFDWNKLYGKNKPQRMSAPTYPFARERYGNRPLDSNVSGGSKPDLKSHLHPLLQENTSNLSEQRFTSRFTGEEFFLKENLVKGQKILPGMAFLEMAQHAVRRSLGNISSAHDNIQLNNMVWAGPIAVAKQPVDVHISIVPDEHGEIAFEIYTDNQNPEDESVIHNQGTAVISSSADNLTLNLTDLRNRLDKPSLSHDTCYEFFKTIGINYSPALQGLETVYIGDHEVLAKLTLPASVSKTKDQFTLHPSLLDAAFQASIGIGCGAGGICFTADGKHSWPFFPFKLEKLEIRHNCLDLMWAWVRHTDENEALEMVNKLDIDLCDEKGLVCVTMRGFSCRSLDGDFASEALPQQQSPFTKIDKSDVPISSNRPEKVSLIALSEVQGLFNERSRPSFEPDIEFPSSSDSSSYTLAESLSPQPLVQIENTGETLQHYLVKSLAEALYMNSSDIDVEKAFIDMGLDSIVAVEWIQLLNKEHGLSILATKVYDYPNILSFTEFLQKSLDSRKNTQTDSTYNRVLNEK